MIYDFQETGKIDLNTLLNVNDTQSMLQMAGTIPDAFSWTGKKISEKPIAPDTVLKRATEIEDAINRLEALKKVNAGKIASLGYQGLEAGLRPINQFVQPRLAPLGKNLENSMSRNFFPLKSLARTFEAVESPLVGAIIAANAYNTYRDNAALYSNRRFILPIAQGMGYDVGEIERFRENRLTRSNTGIFKGIPSWIGSKLQNDNEGVLSQASNKLGNILTSIPSLKMSSEQLAEINTKAMVSYNQFASALTTVNTILKKSDTQLKEYGQSLQQLVKDDLKNSVTSVQALNAAYEAASAGFTKTKDNQEVMVAGLKLAKSGAADTGEVMRMLTQVMNTYGASAEQASTYAAKFNMIVEKGITTVPELAASIGQVAVIAKSAGVNINEISAAMATMTTKGMGTAEAGTALTGLLMSTISKTPQAEKAIRELNKNITNEEDKIRLDKATIESDKDGRGLIKQLENISKATRGDASLAADIFSSQTAYRGYTTLMNDKGATLSQNFEAMKNATVTSLEKVFGIKLNNQDERLNKIFNRMEESYTKIGEKIEPFFDKSLTSMENFVTKLADSTDSFSSMLLTINNLKAGLENFGQAMKNIIGLLVSGAGLYAMSRLGGLMQSGMTSFQYARTSQDDLLTKTSKIVPELLGINQANRQELTVGGDVVTSSAALYNEARRRQLGQRIALALPQPLGQPLYNWLGARGQQQGYETVDGQVFLEKGTIQANQNFLQTQRPLSEFEKRNVSLTQKQENYRQKAGFFANQNVLDAWEAQKPSTVQAQIESLTQAKQRYLQKSGFFADPKYVAQLDTRIQAEQQKLSAVPSQTPAFSQPFYSGVGRIERQIDDTGGVRTRMAAPEDKMSEIYRQRTEAIQKTLYGGTEPTAYQRAQAQKVGVGSFFQGLFGQEDRYVSARMTASDAAGVQRELARVAETRPNISKRRFQAYEQALIRRANEIRYLSENQANVQQYADDLMAADQNLTREQAQRQARRDFRAVARQEGLEYAYDDRTGQMKAQDTLRRQRQSSMFRAGRFLNQNFVRPVARVGGEMAAVSALFYSVGKLGENLYDVVQGEGAQRRAGYDQIQELGESRYTDQEVKNLELLKQYSTEIQQLQKTYQKQGVDTGYKELAQTNLNQKIADVQAQLAKAPNEVARKNLEGELKDLTKQRSAFQANISGDLSDIYQIRDLSAAEKNLEEQKLAQQQIEKEITDLKEKQINLTGQEQLNLTASLDVAEKRKQVIDETVKSSEELIKLLKGEELGIDKSLRLYSKAFNPENAYQQIASTAFGRAGTNFGSAALGAAAGFKVGTAIAPFTGGLSVPALTTAGALGGLILNSGFSANQLTQKDVAPFLAATGQNYTKDAQGKITYLTPRSGTTALLNDLSNWTAQLGGDRTGKIANIYNKGFVPIIEQIKELDPLLQAYEDLSLNETAQFETNKEYQAIQENIKKINNGQFVSDRAAKTDLVARTTFGTIGTAAGFFLSGGNPLGAAGGGFAANFLYDQVRKPFLQQTDLRKQLEEDLKNTPQVKEVEGSRRSLTSISPGLKDTLMKPLSEITPEEIRDFSQTSEELIKTKEAQLTSFQTPLTLLDEQLKVIDNDIETELKKGKVQDSKKLVNLSSQREALSAQRDRLQEGYGEQVAQIKRIKERAESIKSEVELQQRRKRNEGDIVGMFQENYQAAVEEYQKESLDADNVLRDYEIADTKWKKAKARSEKDLKYAASAEFKKEREEFIAAEQKSEKYDPTRKNAMFQGLQEDLETMYTSSMMTAGQYLQELDKLEKSPASKSFSVEESQYLQAKKQELYGVEATEKIQGLEVRKQLEQAKSNLGMVSDEDLLKTTEQADQQALDAKILAQEKILELQKNQKNVSAEILQQSERELETLKLQKEELAQSTKYSQEKLALQKQYLDLELSRTTQDIKGMLGYQGVGDIATLDKSFEQEKGLDAQTLQIKRQEYNDLKDKNSVKAKEMLLEIRDLEKQQVGKQLGQIENVTSIISQRNQLVNEEFNLRLQQKELGLEAFTPEEQQAVLEQQRANDQALTNERYNRLEKLYKSKGLAVPENLIKERQIQQKSTDVRSFQAQQQLIEQTYADQLEKNKGREAEIEFYNYYKSLGYNDLGGVSTTDYLNSLNRENLYNKEQATIKYFSDLESQYGGNLPEKLKNQKTAVTRQLDIEKFNNVNQYAEEKRNDVSRQTGLKEQQLQLLVQDLEKFGGGLNNEANKLIDEIINGKREEVQVYIETLENGMRELGQNVSSETAQQNEIARKKAEQEIKDLEDFRKRQAAAPEFNRLDTQIEAKARQQENIQARIDIQRKMFEAQQLEQQSLQVTTDVLGNLGVESPYLDRLQRVQGLENQKQQLAEDRENIKLSRQSISDGSLEKLQNQRRQREIELELTLNSTTDQQRNNLKTELQDLAERNKLIDQGIEAEKRALNAQEASVTMRQKALEIEQEITGQYLKQFDKITELNVKSQKLDLASKTAAVSSDSLDTVISVSKDVYGDTAKGRRQAIALYELKMKASEREFELQKEILKIESERFDLAQEQAKLTMQVTQAQLQKDAADARNRGDTKQADQLTAISDAIDKTIQHSDQIKAQQKDLLEEQIRNVEVKAQASQIGIMQTLNQLQYSPDREQAIRNMTDQLVRDEKKEQRENIDKYVNVIPLTKEEKTWKPQVVDLDKVETFRDEESKKLLSEMVVELKKSNAKEPSATKMSGSNMPPVIKIEINSSGSKTEPQDIAKAVNKEMTNLFRNVNDYLGVTT